MSAALRWRSGECSDRIEPWLRYRCGAGRYTTIYWYLEYLIGLAIKLKRDSAQHAMLLVRMTTRQPTDGMAYGSGGSEGLSASCCGSGARTRLWRSQACAKAVAAVGWAGGSALSVVHPHTLVANRTVPAPDRNRSAARRSVRRRFRRTLCSIRWTSPA